MGALVAWALAVPLLTAMVLLAIQEKTSRFWHDALALVASATCLACTAALTAGSLDHRIVYWAGGWFPENGDATGIALIADPVSSGLASLVALLTTLAFAFSWRYFHTVKALFHSLMLMFMAAMVGFCFAGDIFTMFVFFEFMSVTGYALTACKPEEAGPLQGAINFALTNSIGAFLILTGLALLYGHTGTLNLAQMGEILAAMPPSSLVTGAFVLIACGLLVKAAVIPFHFAFADAHAVAPTPVSVLFSGVMIELGMYGVARIYWSVFSDALPAAGVGAAMIALGVFGALAGAVMCVLQTHLKRLLAFSSISHSAAFLIGIGLMSREALAGTLVYILSHGLVKGALFMSVGVVLHRLGSVHELRLRGRGRRLVITRTLMAAGALALVAAPGFGTFTGKSMIEKAAATAGHGWLTYVLLLTSALTAGAVFRIIGRVFLGWGRPLDPVLQARSLVQDAEPETDPAADRHFRHTPASMLAPIALLLMLTAAVAALPQVSATARSAAEHFTDRPGFAREVLEGRVPLPLPAPLPHQPDLKAFALALMAILGAMAAALALLQAPHHTTPVVLTLKRIHSGHVGDYVVWLILGVLVTAALVWSLAR